MTDLFYADFRSGLADHRQEFEAASVAAAWLSLCGYRFNTKTRKWHSAPPPPNCQKCGSRQVSFERVGEPRWSDKAACGQCSHQGIRADFVAPEDPLHRSIARCEELEKELSALWARPAS